LAQKEPVSSSVYTQSLARVRPRVHRGPPRTSIGELMSRVLIQEELSGLTPHFSFVKSVFHRV
jgi:hypothetical protein